MVAASFWSGARESRQEVAGIERARLPAGKRPLIAGGGPEPDRWERAASDIELARQQLAAARRGPVAELRAAADVRDGERADQAAGALGWTLASVRTRLGDAEDGAAGAPDLVAAIARLRDEERALAREVDELRARAEPPAEREQLRVIGWQDAVDGYAAFYRSATRAGAMAAPAPQPAVPAGATAAEWIAAHAASLQEAVARRLDALPLAPGHPRLAWTGDAGRFLGRVLSGSFQLAGRDPWEGVRRALVPADLDAIVDGARVLDPERPDGRARGPLRWFPEVAIAIADVLAGRVIDSLARLAARYVVVADARAHAHPGWPAAACLPEVADFVPAHPVDPAVIAALCSGSVEVLPGAAVELGRPLELGAASRLRRVARYEWQAARGAWSWLRVHEPADATLEEVAATFLGRPEAAYRVSASPPLFGFLPEDAARIPGARAALPLHDGAEQARLFLDVARPIDALVGGTVTAHPVDQLAESELGEQAALAQAERASEPRPDAGRVPARARDEASEQFCIAGFSLGLIARDLERFGLSWRVREVRERTAARRQQVAEVAGGEVGRWCALARQQARVVDDIAIELDSLVRVAGAAGPAATVDPALGELAGELAGAAAVSDLIEAAAARLAMVRAHKALAIAASFDRHLDRAMHELEANRFAAFVDGPDPHQIGREVLVDDLRARDGELRAEVGRLRVRLAQGEVDAVALQDLERRVRAAAREAELVAAISRLNPAIAALEDEQGWMAILTLCEDDLEDSKQELRALRSSFQLQFRMWNQRQAAIAARAGSLAPGEATEEARDALAELESGLRALGSERLQHALQRAHDTIEDARLRKAIADIALLIGMTVVSGGVGALTRGAALGLRWGRLGVALAELGGEAGSMAVMRAATSDETVLEALVSELGGHGAMALVGHGVAATRLGHTLDFMRAQGRGGRVAAGAFDVGIHAGSAAAGGVLAAEIDSVVRHGRHVGGDEAAAAARDGALMGPAFAVTHRVLGRYRDRMSQLGARAQDLVTRGHHARRVAEEIAHAGDPEAGLAVARLARDLVEAEVARLDAIARDPEALAEIGRHTHATLLAQALADSDALAREAGRGLARHADGIRPGRAGAILAEARRAGVPMTAEPGAHKGTWLHRVGDGPAQVAITHRERRAELALHLRPGGDELQAQREHIEDIDRPRPRLADQVAPPSAAEVARVRQQAESEAQLSIAEVAALPTRSLAASWVAASIGAPSRYLSRIMTRADLTAHKTFGRDDRELVFAGDVADLRGLSPIEAVRRIGYTPEWARRLVGEELVLVVYDPRAGSGGAKVEAIGWPELEGLFSVCPELVSRLGSHGIFASDLRRLFAVMQSGPLDDWPRTSNAEEVRKVIILRQVLEDAVSVNPEYTGTNVTAQPDGQPGIRELALRTRPEDLALDDHNHKDFSLGTFTAEDYAALFPDEPLPSPKGESR
jgi:hypothetical protein